MNNEELKEEVKFKVFDFDKAAQIIRDKAKEYENKHIQYSASFKNDRSIMSDIYFEHPSEDIDSILKSIHDTPILIIQEYYTGKIIDTIECWNYSDVSRFNEVQKWDEESLKILNNGK